MSGVLPHARGVGTLDSQLLHPLFQPLPVPALGLGHPAQDVGLPIWHPAGDQVIHRTGDYLAFPRLEQALAHLWRSSCQDADQRTHRALACTQVRRSVLVTALAALLVALGLVGCGGGSSSSTTSSPAGGRANRNSARRKAKRNATVRRVAVLKPPPGAPTRSVQVPVLTYHRVHTMPAVGELDLIVDPANFAAELKAIHEGGYHTISQAQLFHALYDGRPLPPKPVLISVDDGYVDDVRTVLPDLERWHMVATFFVITGRMSEPGFLNASQIRELDRAGMDVGDHTAHHVDLRLLTSAQLKTETAGSRKALEAVLGHPVYFFAYPFGDFNDQVLQAVRSAGFTMAYTTQGGTTESTAAPLTMPRVHVGRSEDPGGLLSVLGGE